MEVPTTELHVISHISPISPHTNLHSEAGHSGGVPPVAAIFVAEEETSSLATSSVVGKVRFFLDSWKKLTSDNWVLQAVSGYSIVFDEKPFQKLVPKEIPFNNEQYEIVDKEVKTLLEIGAVVPSEHEPDEFISTLFIVPKPNGKYRPVINLKFLNEYVQYNHFKQEI